MDRSFKNLRRIRLKLDLTQAQMGEILGVKSGTYAAYEQGVRETPSEIIDKAFWLEDDYDSKYNGKPKSLKDFMPPVIPPDIGLESRQRRLDDLGIKITEDDIREATRLFFIDEDVRHLPLQDKEDLMVLITRRLAMERAMGRLGDSRSKITALVKKLIIAFRPAQESE